MMTRKYEEIVDDIWDIIVIGNATDVAKELINARNAFQAENQAGCFNPGSILMEHGVTPKFHAAVMHEYNRIASEVRQAG
ncbi:hypothetical protein GYA27_04285 [candidate division WWE3 bacterium]|uniref:Uncharacterized protein n=1 Tax=candidate division WWE3 bacterium TaxID=2053526 RepID=A0A7X9HI89_UNCKA|nr:hypothetical protein [candidate division WWE3 bacterium]